MNRRLNARILLFAVAPLAAACARPGPAPAPPAPASTMPAPRAAPASPAPATAVAAATQAPRDPAVAEFASRANAARRAARCPELIWHDGLAAVATRHSADMIERGYFAHDNPDGRSPFDRLAAAHIRFQQAAENIIYGARTGERALEMWMESPGHRANLLNCEYTHHGVGRVETHWTHVFIRP